jgi:hypothetical protein
VQVAGLPVVSRDEKMRESVGKAALRVLSRRARAKRRGKAPCPHCGRYQNWMRVYPAWLSLAAALLSLGLPLLAIANADRLSDAAVWLVIAGLPAGFLLPRLLYRRLAGATPARKKDAWRSMKDHDLQAFFARSAEAGEEPFIAWQVSVGRQKVHGRLVSLGIHDTTGGSILHESWSSDAVLKAMSG